MRYDSKKAKSRMFKKLRPVMQESVKNSRNNVIYAKLFSLCVKMDSTEFKDAIESYTSKGFPIDYVPDGYVNTLLEWVVKTSYNFEAKGVNHIKALVEAGADLNVTSKTGEPLIMTAICRSPAIEVIESLCDLGADVNAKDEKGNTAFSWVAKDYIFDKKIDKEERSYLMACMGTLLEAGADPYLDKSWQNENIGYYKADGKRKQEILDTIALYEEQKNVESISQYSVFEI